ncbi:PTS system, mannitol-specific IIA component [Carnobacterium sp. AT7]|uniref:PTS sugar transporter subunit IIA n=1 Tax=Carnobacterium TaxID=2747 RepID=UPI00015F2BEE|nr:MULTISPECIES: PTS sugar transporter subunit IIA [Carnobacterium]EDP67459.1 PTS system, mannitol-specific IIA component [Carnobacterium sp. AT7]
MDILELTSIKLNQSFNTKEEAIRAAGEILVENEYVKAGYIEEMLKREENVTTYMGNFIAIPHGTENSKDLINQSGISIVQIPGGVDFGTPEEEKLVTVVFGIAGVGNEHLDILSQIAVYCSEVENVVKLADASSEQEIKELLEGIE